MKKNLLFLLAITQLAAAFNPAALKQNIYAALPYANFSLGALLPSIFFLRAPRILEKNFKKIKDPKVLAFMQCECAQIIDTPINFYVGRGFQAGFIAFAVGNNNIALETSYYEILEQYLNKAQLTAQEQSSLNIFKFIIQHEAGHIKNKDTQKRFLLAIAQNAVALILFELSKKAYDFEYSQLATVLGLNTLSALLQGYFAQRQEYAADHGVTEEQALAGGKQFFKNLMKMCENNPNLALKMRLDLSHPLPVDRLARLEKMSSQDAQLSHPAITAA